MNPFVMLFGLLGAVLLGASRSDSSEPEDASFEMVEEEELAVAETFDVMTDVTDEVPMPDDHVGHNMGSETDEDLASDLNQHEDHGVVAASSETVEYQDIMEFGVFHGTSSHTHHESLEGGRTAITTEAHEAYNDLRAFLGLEPADLETIGEWAFANEMTNNEDAYNQDIPGVGLYYSMQGAKVGWIADDAFDPQILADIQRTAREDDVDGVMQMVEAYGLDGFAGYLEETGSIDTFVNTLKMEPHYGGWMHGRVHGGLEFDDASGQVVATAHDINHLTVLSHDQQQPFMNDTFDWPQWPALDVPQADVANYFQSMVTLGDPHGEGITDTDVAGVFVDGDGAIYLAALSNGEVLDESLPTEELVDEFEF